MVDPPTTDRVNYSLQRKIWFGGVRPSGCTSRAVKVGFRQGVQVARDLKTLGFNLLTCPNNHASDWGTEGLALDCVDTHCGTAAARRDRGPVGRAHEPFDVAAARSQDLQKVNKSGNRIIAFHRRDLRRADPSNPC